LYGPIAIYGQESNFTTWRLAKMNLAIRGIGTNLGSEPADSYHKDQYKDLKADFILANAVQHERLGRRSAAGGRPLEVRPAAGGQRRLRLDQPLYLPLGAHRHRRLRHGQRHQSQWNQNSDRL
jgi:hypothetical protein